MSSKPKVLMTDGRNKAREKVKVHKLVEDIAEVIWAPVEARSSDIELAKYVEDIDVFVVGLAPITRRVIEKANKLKLIARLGAGYDNVDLKAATERGIYVTYTPRTSVEGMAEHVIGAMIALSRGFLIGNKMIREGRFEEAWNLLFGNCDHLLAKTLGIIGMGAVGRRLAERACTFHMRILGYDPYVSKEDFDEVGAIKVDDLDYLLKESDFISIHCALTPETRHLISEERLRIMKNTAYIINTARGAIIDENALYKALKERWIAGAALDVFDPEPPRPDNPLFTLDNILLTPHISGANRERVEAVGRIVAENVRRVLRGELPIIETIVNKDVLKRK